MSDIRFTGGAMQPSSKVTAHKEVNLGELKRPTFWWRLAQLYKSKNDLPMLIAQKMLGRVNGVIQLKTAMLGKVYKADWTKLAPWQQRQLRELLELNTDPYQLVRHFGGQVIDYGVLSRKTITEAGVAFIVDAWQNSVELEIMRFHALGTNNLAENNTHTALQVEITGNHYNNGNRPTGTTAEGGGANIFETVGTHVHATAGDTITEHAVVSVQTGAYVMLDRHIFTGVPLAVSDTFVTTYRITLTSNG